MRKRDGDCPRRSAQQSARHERQVVVKVVFEEGMKTGDSRDAQCLGEAQPLVVGNERRLDMHQIVATLAQGAEQPFEGTRFHHPILGIEDQDA